MKFVLFIIAVLLFSSLSYSQSGRRAKTPTTPAPVPAEEPKPTPKNTEPEAPPVTAEKNQEYRCTEDEGLARVLEAGDGNERVISAKEADERVQITKRPTPDYTREARRNGIQGFVTLRALFSANGKVSRLKVVKALPAGLTENAIRAACKIQFQPAVKNGQPASTWVTVEYVFRLADSSIFRP